MRRLLLSLLLLAVTCIVVVALLSRHAKPPVATSAKTILRVGYFPNVTHAQGVIGRTLSAENKGWFESRLGPDVEIQWFPYNAGPSAMEAIFTGAIDLTYVGPSPVLNAYIRARGEDIRIISGAARGGSALIVRPASGIEKPADFKDKKLATPQFGNTQDIAARSWLRKQGFKITQLSGEVFVLPTANADQLPLFQQGKLDAVWTVEPWVSRLVLEAGGRVFLEDAKGITTVLASGVEALEKKPLIIQRFVAAHRELTDWINTHPDEAQVIVQRGLTREMRREVKLALIRAAWPRLTFANDIDIAPLNDLADDARALGFIRITTTLDRLLALPQ